MNIFSRSQKKISEIYQEIIIDEFKISIAILILLIILVSQFMLVIQAWWKWLAGEQVMATKL